MPTCEGCGCDGAATWGNGRTLCITCWSGVKDEKVAVATAPLEPLVKRKRPKSRAKAEKKKPRRKTPRTCGICQTTEWMEPQWDEKGERKIQKCRAPWLDDRGEAFKFCIGVFESPDGKKEHRCVPCQKAMEKPMIDPMNIGRCPPTEATTWICGYKKDQISEAVCLSRQNGKGWKKRGGKFPKQCCTKRCPLFSI